MKSKLALALVSALALSAAMPVVTYAAQSTHERDNGDNQNDFSNFRSAAILRELQDRGINATSVEPWGGLIRAYVQTNHGLIMEFFEPGSLNPAP